MSTSAAQMSQHWDEQDSDGESPSLDGHDLDKADKNEAGKPGRKKNPNSQAARRDQNRIAQREFRLRKQQRIRDLEARVEILSGNKDEAVSELRLTLKDLMEENHTLRGLVRGLSQFIGEGSGGLISKLGWNMEEFTTFVNRGETDTAYESYQRRKKMRSDAPAAPGSTSAHGQKRAAEESIMAPSKRGRSNSTQPDNIHNGGYPPVSMPVAGSSQSMYPPGSMNSPHDASLFSDLMRGSGGSAMFMPPASTPVPVPSYPSTSNTNTPPGHPVYQASYIPPLIPSGGGAAPAGGASMNIETPLAPMQYSPSGPSPMSDQQQPAGFEQETDDHDPKKMEAYRLIHYQLDNFKRNRGYCLPASLRPTLVQRTIPHESLIDGIIHPELRDRIILLKGRFDLIDCLHDYRVHTILHGDDVLAHANWEIDETWLKKYAFLADQATLNVCNRWRRERGEELLQLADIAPANLVDPV